MNNPILNKHFHDWRFLWMFVSLLLIMLSQVLFIESELLSMVATCIYLYAMLITLTDRGISQRFRYALALFWVAAVLCKILYLNFQNVHILVLSKVFIILLILSVAICIIRRVLFSLTITTDTLFAAIVAYLMIALTFSNLYLIADLLIPSAFHFPDHLLNNYSERFEYQFTYLSFVTIATLGYGDITPSHPLTQYLTSIEAIIGQFYVAIIVAWLVSIHVAQHQRKRE